MSKPPKHKHIYNVCHLCLKHKESQAGCTLKTHCKCGEKKP